MYRITYTCPVGFVIDEPNSYNEQPAFIPLLQETFVVMCGDDATWTPLAPGGGTAMPSCIRRFKGTVSQDFLLLVFFINQLPPSPRVSH
jgi:hypothetical protein